MGNRARDAAFARFVAAHRQELLGVTYLMFSSPERSEHVVRAELARLYSSWPAGGDPRQAVLREILTSTPARLVLPNQAGDRFELVDGRADLPPGGIVAELANLDDDARRAVILVGFVGLPVSEAAAVLHREESEVRALVAGALAKLDELDELDKFAERDPARPPDELREQLRAAAQDVRADPDSSGAADLERGRLLVRRRRLRTGLVAAGAILAVLVGLTQLTAPATRADEPAGRSATSTPPVVLPASPSPQPTCDTRQAACRVAVLSDWQISMTRLARSYLDPRHDYFTDYSAGDSGSVGSAQLWGGGDGALGLNLSRSAPGATTVYVQVATSRRQALRCGNLTHHPCAPQDFLDGNTFNLTQTTDVRQGMEIQYSPRGDEVITVVARNTGTGKALDITRGELMSLVTDSRLRLPPH